MRPLFSEPQKNRGGTGAPFTWICGPPGVVATRTDNGSPLNAVAASTATAIPIPHPVHHPFKPFIAPPRFSCLA